jgi:ketosteroid isomerase-like protein
MAGVSHLGPMTAVRAFVEAFNNDDAELAEAACADETLIIDDFPPYEWSGGGSVTRWFHDMDRMATKYRMSEPSVALEEPRHVIVSEQHAYVVVPIDVRWLEDGTHAERTGSMTMAIREGTEGWRISALAWTWN